MKFHAIRAAAIVSTIVLMGASGGCITKRTVTQNGQVVSEGYKVKRPIRDAMKD